MARFEVDASTLWLRMGTGEHVAALRGDVGVRLADVVGVSVVEHAWREVHGMRLGTGVPGVLVAGTFSDVGGDTVAVCHGGRPGVRVVLRGSSPQLLVATVDDPQAVAAMIVRAAGLDRG